MQRFLTLFRQVTPTGWVRMLVFGAIAGSLFDGFHTHGGATSYPHPIVWMMAWWTPFLFAFAYTLSGFSYRLMRTAPPVSAAARVLSLIAFAALYFATAYLPASNVVKLVVVLTGAIVLWVVTDRSPATIVVGIFGAVVGPLTEIFFVHLGIFSHLQPDFAGIPMWLPALYVANAPGAGPFAAWLGFGDSAEVV